MIDSKVKDYFNRDAATRPPEWFQSKNGNPTIKIGEQLITVFKAKAGGYKWVINTENGEPVWGKDMCVTADRAKEKALQESKKV